MRTGIVFVLYVALVAGGMAVRADDTLDQAAARAALEQKMRELDHPEVQSSPATNSAALTPQPAVPTTNTISLHAAPAAAPPADADFPTQIPAANTSAQAAALAAVEKELREPEQPENRPAPNTNSMAASATTTPAAVPVNTLSAVAKPVTESPAAEAPVATSPATASSAVTPLSAAPAVVVPAPKVSTASAAATAVAETPVAAPGPVAIPARTPVTAATAPPALPSSSAGQARPANELVTTTGVIYKNVEVQRVTADGIVISYIPAHGDWAMAKIYFRDLPPDLRQRYEK